MIRQFDLLDNPSPRYRSTFPYVVMLQSHLLQSAHTAVVAPVQRGPDPAVTLTSVPFRFRRQTLMILVGELASLDAQSLGRPISSVADHEDEIRRALDRLFTGF